MPTQGISYAKKSTRQLDNSIELTEDDWGLTLICAKSSNHAQIIIEKVDSSCYLMELAEFNGWGKARGVRAFKKLNPNNIKYDGKTKTWLLAKEKIEKLINSIEAEASLPIEKQPKFSIFGRLPWPMLTLF